MMGKEDETILSFWGMLFVFFGGRAVQLPGLLEEIQDLLSAASKRFSLAHLGDCFCQSSVQENLIYTPEN